MSPATYAAEHLFARMDWRSVQFAPGGVNPVIVDLDPATTGELLEIKEFRRFAAMLMRSVGTGDVDAFEIIAATDADGTGATVVVAHALASPVDAVNDRIVLECDVEQVREVLATATHVGVRAELATGTDTCAIGFVRADPYYPHGGLTADYIA